MNNHRFLTTKKVNNFCIEHFLEIPRRVVISPTTCEVTFAEQPRRVFMLSFREPDEFFPEPIFAFSSEFLANARALRTNFVMLVDKSNGDLSLVDIRNLRFLRDEFGEYVGINFEFEKAV